LSYSLNATRHRRRLLGHSIALFLILFAMASLAASSFSQSQPAASNMPQSDTDLSLNAPDFDKAIWANAKPYLDYPLPALIAAVPELEGLQPATTQSDLRTFLHSTGKTCVELLQRMPNVVAHEEVITQERTVSAISQGGVARRRIDLKPQRQQFEYLLLRHQTEDAGVLDEYRTDKHGQPIIGSAAQLTQGFVNDWLHFYPGNLGESRFRYLGEQEIDKHHTLVIVFAEIPEAMKFPAQFNFGKTPISILLQGVAWIDSSDFRIVRMREDILAPRPDIYLNQFTTRIRFGEVNISKAASSLWLPQEVDIDWEFQGIRVQRRHSYSDYRLFAAKAKIIPIAP
jgi:hypothetical protein